MELDDAAREAAHEAKEAVRAVMQEYRAGRVTDEDDITGELLGALKIKLNGPIGGLMWTASVVRHRAGRAAEESRIGADILMHVSVKTSEQEISKGVLIQAKRPESGGSLKPREHVELKAQCTKMTAITPSSYVFNYARRGMRCGPATRIMSSTNRKIADDCVITPYRFFYDLFRCPIGDPRVTSALVSELPKPARPAVIEIKATQIR